MGSEDLDEQAEELEEAGKAISRDEGRRSLKLWFAVLGSPIAWTGHLGVNYSLEEWFACSRSAQHLGEILGIRVDVVSIMINTAMLAIAALSGLVAYRCWKKLKGQDGERQDGEGQDGEGQNGEGQDGDDDTTDRARWMAFAGMVEGALFTGIILLGYLPSFMIGICETTP
ncbi:MAG: hypothetical protein M3314_07715 [Actinomycetota bacterium]|nr:hypothetical protein [Actinomycetota bacterium]